MTGDWLTDALRWGAAFFAAVACYYSVRFLVRYRRVNWQASPWGRHVMRFTLLIAVSMGTAVTLRVLALFDFDNQTALALIGFTIYLWVAYEVRRRFFLEREQNHQPLPPREHHFHIRHHKETGDHD